MTSEREPTEEMRWLLEPPAPGTINLYIAVGEGTELTPEVREAVENLMRALQEAEVRGQEMGGRPTRAGECGWNCVILGRCAPEYTTPCANKDVCHIVPCPQYIWTARAR